MVVVVFVAVVLPLLFGLWLMLRCFGCWCVCLVAVVVAVVVLLLLFFVDYCLWLPWYLAVAVVVVG